VFAKELVILETLKIDQAAFEARTGWVIKPEGACKGDACVPLPSGAVMNGQLDARILSEKLGMSLIADEARKLWALGPETAITGKALTSAVAPDISLPDLDGNLFRLADLRGRKVVLVSWASW
jgi:AhpC/TSA family